MGVGDGCERAGRQTTVVMLLIPIRIARHILRLLVAMLLMSPLVEHLFEELELGIDAREEDGECEY